MHWFRRHDRGRPPHPDILTPAEWRVLEQVREGLPNAEIAVRLGLSVNTVRVHVSNMLAKLELPDRRALAAWEGEPAEASRRALGPARLLAPLGWLRESAATSWLGKVAGIGVVAALSIGAIVGLQAVNDGNGAPGTVSPSPTITATATATGTPDPGVIEGPLHRLLSSLDPDPQPTAPDEERVLPEPPESPFPPHDGESMVLYDIEAGEAINLGPALPPGYFSPDSRHLVWIALDGDDSELRVLDLETREERSLGPGAYLEPYGGGGPFINDRTVLVGQGLDVAAVVVDIETGQRTPAHQASPNRMEVQGDLELVWGDRTYRLRDRETGMVLAEFAATQVGFGAPGELILATPWQRPLSDVPGSANIYLVDIDAAEATFVATVELDHPPLPLAAEREVIAWTENYCSLDDSGESEGVTWFLDRESGDLVRLDRAIWAGVTPDGRIAEGDFGADRLIDRHTLEYEVVLPTDPGNNVMWSPDYRFASVGETGGHDGICGPP